MLRCRKWQEFKHSGRAARPRYVCCVQCSISLASLARVGGSASAKSCATGSWQENTCIPAYSIGCTRLHLTNAVPAGIPAIVHVCLVEMRGKHVLRQLQKKESKKNARVLPRSKLARAKPAATKHKKKCVGRGSASSFELTTIVTATSMRIHCAHLQLAKNVVLNLLLLAFAAFGGGNRRKLSALSSRLHCYQRARYTDKFQRLRAVCLRVYRLSCTAFIDHSS